MSDGSDYNPHIIQPEPLRRIGAQDLMKVADSIYGHLRKQGKFKKIFGSRKWALKFIIVSQGCVYCFNDEHAENPISAFSLCVYESVSELDKASMPHSFEIIHEEKGKASHVFAAETDEKRREWVVRIEEVLQQCRQFLGKLSADSGIDEGPPSRKPRSKQLGPLPSVPGKTPPQTAARAKKYKEAKSEYDLESTDEEGEGEEYDEVAAPPAERAPSPPRPSTLPRPGIKTPQELMTEEFKQRATMRDRPPLPIPSPTGRAPPMSSSQGRAQPPLPATLPPSMSQSQKPAKGYINNGVFDEMEYLYSNSARDEAISYLQGRDVGTFLVRNARSGTGQVLTVNTPVGTKEFKITEKECKVSLDSKEWFPALTALLTYYNQNNLPKSDYACTLQRGYRTVS